MDLIIRVLRWRHQERTRVLNRLEESLLVVVWETSPCASMRTSAHRVTNSEQRLMSSTPRIWATQELLERLVKSSQDVTIIVTMGRESAKLGDTAPL
jgi:hypothetical protein